MSLRDIGAHFTAKSSAAPSDLADSGTTIGSGQDRAPAGDNEQYEGGKLVLLTGAASGSPTAQTVTAKVQESSDDSTYTDVSGASVDSTSDNDTQELDVDLRTAKQYVRAHVSASLSGGTSPKIEAAATLLLAKRVAS